MAFQQSHSSSSSSTFVHFVVDSTTSFIHSSNSPSSSDDSLSLIPKFHVASGLEHTVTETPSSNLSIYLKIIIGSFLVLVILISIFGNLLVCVAISSDRRLRKLGNLFIVSLAIADLCVGALVMTFALANDLLDYWPFGPQLCEIWIAFDISCSTCSIINLCAIALDRYVHIKDPMRYNRWMTKKVVIGAVSLIWLVSCGISFVPISLGWHKPDHYSVPLAVPVNQSAYQLEDAVPTPKVNLTVPFHLAARQTLHRLLHRHRINRRSVTEHSPIFSNTFFYANPEYNSFKHMMTDTAHNARLQTPTTTNFGYTDDPMFPQCTLDLTPTYAVVSSTISFYLPCIVMLYLYAKLYSICQEHVRCIKSMTKFQAVPISHQSLAPNHNQSYIPSTPQIGTPTRAHSGPLPPTRISVSSNIGSASAGSQSHVTEHKAAITLGIIMGTFLASWVPFFCINIWAAFCKTCVPGLVFKILTWLGYFNSCMNPVIYSIFNTEFRDAFRRILIRYIFNGDTTAACSRLVPCKTPRSSTATVTGSLTVNNQIHNHNLNNNNNNCTKSHFNVMTTIAVSTGSMSQLPKASIDDRSLDSGILNASPHNENENHEAEDVEVELILKHHIHEPTLNSPNNIQFSSEVPCDASQIGLENNTNCSVDKPTATYCSHSNNAPFSDGLLLNPRSAHRKASQPMIPKISKIKPRLSHSFQHKSLDYENSAVNSQENSHKSHKSRNGSTSSLNNGAQTGGLEENNNFNNNVLITKYCKPKNHSNISQVTQL